MFKCTDCNKTFEVKPDYCDCGNNIFEEIIIEQKPVQQKINSVKTKPETIDPRLKKMMSSFDIFSVSFFGICIVLSILVLLFFANPKPQEDVEEFLNKGMEETSSEVNVPKIDEIWDNTLPKAEVQEEVQKKKIEQPIIVQTPIVQQVQQPSKVTQRQVQSASKPIKKSISKTVKPRVTQQAVKKPVSTTQVAKKPVQTPVDSPKIVLDKYKVSLRNALFSKLNLSKVTGSGLAIVEFSIDENGKLLNRHFSQQSGNKNLDDAVYNMLMAMPFYHIPPSAYKGENLKLKVTFNFGQYNFDLR